MVRVLTGITVEFTTIDQATGEVIRQWCETSPSDCCAATTGTATSTAGDIVDAPCQGIAALTWMTADAVFTNKTGDCTCLPDNGTITGADTDYCTIGTIGCPGNIELILQCVAGQYVLSTAAEGITITGPIGFSSSPFVIVFDISGYGLNCGANGGSARLTISI